MIFLCFLFFVQCLFRYFFFSYGGSHVWLLPPLSNKFDISVWHHFHVYYDHLHVCQDLPRSSSGHLHQCLYCIPSSWNCTYPGGKLNKKKFKAYATKLLGLFFVLPRKCVLDSFLLDLHMCNFLPGYSWLLSRETNAWSGSRDQEESKIQNNENGPNKYWWNQ